MTDELLHHWALHEVDERAVRLETELARQAELRRPHEARIAAAQAALAALDRHAADAARRRRQLERDLAAIEAEEKRFAQQLDAVVNPRQYEAVQHELAAVRARRSDAETAILELLEGEERDAGGRPALALVLARAGEEGAAAFATLDRAAAEARAELAALAARRDGLAAALPAAARTRYERLRAARGGRAVSAIVQGACGGCFRGLPPHVLQEAKHRDHLIVCDGCGRLLLLPPVDAPAA